MQRRLTSQRKVIYDIVKYLDHPTSENVLTEVKKTHPDFGRATVFRNLGVLVEQGIIRKLSFSENPTRYDAKIAEHSHLICEKCGRVWDIMENNKITYPDTSDILIKSHSIIYYGLCKNCQSKEEKNVKS